MSEFRLSPEAEAELDGIWIHMARDSGSIDLATRVVEGINERFWLLAGIHTWDDGVAIWVRVCAASPLAIKSSFTVSRRTMWC